jgi:SRSO17 transposase
VGSRLSAPGPQERRFAAYIEGLAEAAGHADRHAPLKNYCKGLLLPGERKSIEPMAARLAGDNVGRMHQSLHHLIADAPWNDQEMLEQVWQRVLPSMQKHGPVVAWIVDDTSFPKQGKHSVGVARQYCGELGKSDNCQAAVSLSVSTWHSSLPIAWRLYLPEVWCQDAERCRQAGVPEEVGFQSKPDIALEQIRQAREHPVPAGVVLADAGYGKGTQFRTALTQLGLQYVVGIESNATVWRPGQQPLPAPARKPGRGVPSKRLPRRADHQPVSVKQLALGLPSSVWKEIGWRQGREGTLRSRFAAVRVRPAHRDYQRTEPYPEEWLLIEWPKKESEPTKYWLSTLPEKTSLKSLVKMAKHRWIIERDYEELKQELGLGHYEGRGWRGFHHHATLCIAAYGFLVAERNRFSPCARIGNLGLSTPGTPPGFRPRGSPRPTRTSQSEIHRDAANDDRATPAPATPSLPFLRIALWIILRVNIRIHHAGCGPGMIRRCAPSILQ